MKFFPPPPPQASVPTLTETPVSESDRKVSAAFLRELYKVVLEREIREDEFNRLMNVLDQGGHYEGLYNGVVYSDEYRAKETGISPAGAVKIFVEVEALLGGEHVNIVQLEQSAISEPAFTLKRKLGEDVLKMIDSKKGYREKLATWYGGFTAKLNAKGADFGMPQRNNLDEYYHYKWALDAEEDRVKWECLNRIHMLMNNAKSGLGSTIQK